MTGTTSPYSYPNDPWPEADHLTQKVPYQKNGRTYKKKEIEAQELCSIDESEDFHDPFSDLSLFLAKKIKRNIIEHGSSQKWSSKIQQDLLETILPEFKIQFPKYRLGIAALKKVWEKVGFYYNKVQTQKEALEDDGKLNINYMIKENLRECAAPSTYTEFPVYSSAHQLALKISECVATLDGVKPRVDLLGKAIWAVQKHLIKNLPTHKNKPSFESYDVLDRLIVKFQIESIVKKPLISQSELFQTLEAKIDLFSQLMEETTSENLYCMISILLANRWTKKTNLFAGASNAGKTAIAKFIKLQLSAYLEIESNSYDQQLLETSQRILTLYPLIQINMKNIDEEELSKAINYTIATLSNRALPKRPNIEPTIYALINAEIHFLRRKSSTVDNNELLQKILATFLCARDLPAWQDSYVHDIEIFTWIVFDEDQNFLLKQPIEYIGLLLEELYSQLMDASHLSFRTLAYKVFKQLKNLKELLLPLKNTDNYLQERKHRIYVWTMQNDMIYRWLHIDPNHKILEEIQKSYDKTSSSIGHVAFVDNLVHKLQKIYPQVEAIFLKQKAETLYRYHWYHILSKPEESSFERFIKWHAYSLPTSPCSLDHLQKLSESLVPLIPFERQKVKSLLGW